MTRDTDPVRLSVVLGAPVDVVWEWLTDPALVARWFGWEHDALEQEIELFFVDGAARSASLRRLETNGGGLFRLLEHADGTLLELRRAPEDTSAPDEPFDAIDEGWTTFVQQLRLGVERHRDDERRCVELHGALRAPDAPRVLDALGLSSIAGLPAGSRWSATVAGEALTGEVWFRSPLQLGLTVDSWGDGLLVVADQPADDARPHGGGQLLLTTFGLDDDAFAAHFERWTGWARATFAG